jgi:signal transduction histidine kinase
VSRRRTREPAAIVVEDDAGVRNDARRLAAHRVAFLGHAVAWTFVVLFLFVVAGLQVAVIVALAWGIGLSMHGFFGVAAPLLRKHWVAQGGDDRKALDTASDRRLTEDRHARSLEELSASIAHEIRNPITAAKSLIQQIVDDPGAAENPEYARIALEELARVERSVSHLLRYARDEELTILQVDLFDIASSALDLLADRIAAGKPRIERDLESGASLRADKDKLRRVVSNLVENALDALIDSADVDPFVRVSCGKSLSGKEVWLRVKDNGAGMPREQLAKIWSPFFTTKKSGTGLGLAITKKLVEAHGGTIEVTSEPSSGTEMIATFPAYEVAAT